MTRSGVARFGALFAVLAMVISSFAVVALSAGAAVAAPSAATVAVSAPSAAPHTLAHSYGVTFSESGLPAGETFQVTVGRSSSSTETDGTTDYLGFYEANGTYSYAITDISGWHQATLAYHGSLTVAGASIAEPTLLYVQVTYTVTFSESGLPSGETFAVSLNGSPQSYTTDGGTDSLAFVTPNGTFPYVIEGVSGWHQTTLPYHGSVVVNGAGVTERTLVFTQVTYSVTFSASGLPSGEMFSVTVAGTPKSVTTVGGNTATLTWTGLPNGTYPYSIAAIPGWQQSTLPSHANLAVVGSSPTEPTLIYTKTTYSVTFSETGLPAGETFQVTMGSGVESLIADGGTDSLLFTETNGTYSYAVADISGWSQSTLASHGTVVVNGASVAEPVLVYSQVTYTIIYTESGLPAGTNWSLNLSGVLENTTGPSLSFTEPNGTYDFKVGYVAGYATTPTYGSTVVAGSNLDLSIGFVQVTYAVTFTESGLPADTTWSVTINAHSVSSSTTTVVFQLPNGTFDYTVPAVPGYTPVVETGSVTVTGAVASVNVPFSLVTYSVTFAESGLPTTHAKPWSVSLDDQVVSTTSSSISFTVGNGTYTYLVRGPAGYRVSSVLAPEGTVTVNGANVPESVTFLKGSTGAIHFHEVGLAAGTTWCVTLGATICSTSTKIVSANLTPGTYSYSVRGVSGLTTLVREGAVPLSSSGTIALAHSATLQVEFTYAVTFTETGLPPGTAWKVSAGGSAVTATTSSIVLYLKNGTYTFHIGKVTGRVASPGSGAIKVAGAPIAIAIKFTAAPSH